MNPITLLTSAGSITDRGPLRRVLPAGALVVLLIWLIVSSATSGPPNMTEVARQLEHLGVVGAGVLVLSVAAAAIFIAPVFGYLSAALQGTMMTGPLLKPLRFILTRKKRLLRERRFLEHANLKNQKDQRSLDERESVRFSDLDTWVSRTPAGDLRPTSLGNVLLAADEYSCARYGLDARVTLPRLRRVMPPDGLPIMDAQLQDLQFACDMCGALILASAMSAAFLINDGRWLFLPLVALVLAVLSYRNAIDAAVVYGETQRVLFDLYRFDLYDALQLPRPTVSGKEERVLGRQLSELLWRGSKQPRPYSHAPGQVPVVYPPPGSDLLTQNPTTT
jgi:hypothetical protein